MSKTWRPNTDVIATDLDNELVLLDPTTREMFTLNVTGRTIWHQIEQGRATDAIVAAVTAEFEVDPETAASHVNTLVSELAQAGLIVPT